MQADLKRVVLLAVVLSMAPALARAEDLDLAQCLNAPTGSEQKQCTQALYQNAADALKKVHARVLENAAKADAANAGSRDGGAVAAIAASQRAWESYREAECWGVVGRGEGSGRTVWVFGCLTEKTRERIRELETPFYKR